MNEVCRLLALLAIDEAARSAEELTEIEALRILMSLRSRASVGYHLTRRGQALLARP